MPAPEAIVELVRQFEQNRDQYRNGAFSEVAARRPQQIVGYLANEAAQAIIAKMETCPRLGQHELYRVSRGEEGSKFNLVSSDTGDFYMVIPADVSRNEVASGIRIKSSTLTPGKLQHLYCHPKLWIIRIQKMRWRQRIVCSLDVRENSAGMKTLQTVVCSGPVSGLHYLQGILASRLINFWCVNFLADDMNKAYLERLPIRTIDFTNPADVARHDRMVSLVTQMLDLNARLAAEGVPHEKAALQRRIDQADRQIDRLVYELYGLTDAEIKVVEEGARYEYGEV